MSGGAQFTFTFGLMPVKQKPHDATLRDDTSVSGTPQGLSNSKQEARDDQENIIAEDKVGLALYPYAPSIQPISTPEARTRLDIYNYRQAILCTSEHNTFTIVAGPPGVGKSTQIPQYIYEAGKLEGTHKMVCVHQTESMARAVADQVCMELCTKLGSVVGFQGKCEDFVSKDTKIIFTSVDVFFWQLTSVNLNVSKLSVVLLEDLHLPSYEMIMCLSLLKRMINYAHRRDLKVILTSNRADVDDLVGYLGNKPPNVEVVSLDRVAQPVTVACLSDTVPDCVDAAFDTLEYLLKTEQKVLGDILVFLPSRYEIEMLAERISTDLVLSYKCEALRLYEGCKESNRAVFAGTSRKHNSRPVVVLTTNVATYDFPIHSISIVIDSGYKLQACDDFSDGFIRTKNEVVPISEVEMEQRISCAGLSGKPGRAFLLYPGSDKTVMPPEPILETQSFLFLTPFAKEIFYSQTCTGLKIVDFYFDNLTNPTKNRVELETQYLVSIGALNDQLRPTPLFEFMSAFPAYIKPEYRNCLYVACNSYPECASNVVSLIASLIVMNNITNALEETELLQLQSNRNAYGDLFSFMFSVSTAPSLFRKYSSVRDRLASYLKQLNCPLKEVALEEMKTDLVIKCFKETFKGNIASRAGDLDFFYLGNDKNNKIFIHPESCLNNMPKEKQIQMVLFDHLVRIGPCLYMKINTVLE
jgi:HrpA-like RNA helicase